jgi:hypothetical protein
MATNVGLLSGVEKGGDLAQAFEVAILFIKPQSRINGEAQFDQGKLVTRGHSNPKLTEMHGSYT